MGLTSTDVMMVFGDKKSVQMDQEGRLTEASKHIPIYYHFVRAMMKRGEITLTYVPYEDNVADILTKVPSGKFHIVLAGLMGKGYCRDAREY